MTSQLQLAYDTARLVRRGAFGRAQAMSAHFEHVGIVIAGYHKAFSMMLAIRDAVSRIILPS